MNIKNINKTVLNCQKNLLALHSTQFVNQLKKGSSKEMLQKYDRGASKHVYDIVTADKSWIYAYEPESTQQSPVWAFQDEPLILCANCYCKIVM